MRCVIFPKQAQGYIILPKKIENPLTEGLPAKIYAFCYIQPQTGYSLAQKIYGVEKYPPTAKIYGWTKILEKKGFIKKEGGVFVSNTKPFLDILHSLVPKFSFNEDESIMIREILDSQPYKNAMSVFISNNTISENPMWLYERTMNNLTTVSNYILSIRLGLGTIDPEEVYSEMRRKKFKCDFTYKKGLTHSQYFKKWKDFVGGHDINLSKFLPITHLGIDRFWQITLTRFRQNLAAQTDEKNKTDFVSKYTNDVHLALLFWLLPNKILGAFQVMYNDARSEDITRIFGDKYK